MRIDVLTLFPEMVRTVAEYGVTGRAAKSGRLQLFTWNPRDFATDSHRTVDDRPYGGGPGMVIKVQPLRDALASARRAGAFRAIYLSPQGTPLDQARTKQLAESPGFTLVAGRYEGVDQRFADKYIDEELSIGDYVLSGGELAAMVVIDAVARLLPGTLGDEASAAQDSFFDGLLDYPHYTRPEEIDGQRVPQVLLSGDHGAIAAWRRQQALGQTWLKRRDLLTTLSLDSADQQLLDGYIESRRRASKHRRH